MHIFLDKIPVSYRIKEKKKLSGLLQKKGRGLCVPGLAGSHIKVHPWAGVAIRDPPRADKIFAGLIIPLQKKSQLLR